MAQRVCPWWLGYLLASPLRRIMSESPEKVVKPYVREGMTVLEPGPGMGFFTLELGRLVGASGRVIAVDIQPRMLSSLKRRVAQAGLDRRVEARQSAPESLRIGDLAGRVDFTLAFALVHELTAVRRFFDEVAAASKPGAGLLFAEPAGHVDPPAFEVELLEAVQAGFTLVDRPVIRRSHGAFLRKA